MKRFRNTIKENVLALGGVTYETYYKNRTANKFGFDPVDTVIIKASHLLETRYFKAFGLLYDCHTAEQTCQRMEERGHDPISPATLDRYRAHSENRIVELIEKSPAMMNALKAALE